MKRITTIAIVLAMVIPVSMSAQIIVTDYTEVTTRLSIVANNINAGNITFDTQAHKLGFLSDIGSVYSNRDAENWSTCASILYDLADDALNWMDNGIVAANVSNVCNHDGAIYDDFTDVLNDVRFDAGDLTDIDENTNENYPLLRQGGSRPPFYGHNVHCLYHCCCYEENPDAP